MGYKETLYYRRKLVRLIWPAARVVRNPANRHFLTGSGRAEPAERTLKKNSEKGGKFRDPSDDLHPVLSGYGHLPVESMKEAVWNESPRPDE
jgi:hypothetical protein